MSVIHVVRSPPVLEVLIEPQSEADWEGVCAALSKLAAQDPTIHITTGEPSGQIVLGGVSEGHLDSVVDALRSLNVAVNVGFPQIAYREVGTDGALRLVGPIVLVEITTTENFIGAVVADLRSRRGCVQDVARGGEASIIQALVPAERMFGYVNALRKICGGQAKFTMKFDHYALVPTTDPEHPPPAGAAVMRA